MVSHFTAPPYRRAALAQHGRSPPDYPTHAGGLPRDKGRSRKKKPRRSGAKVSDRSVAFSAYPRRGGAQCGPLAPASVDARAMPDRACAVSGRPQGQGHAAELRPELALGAANTAEPLNECGCARLPLRLLIA
jgi:hypothetical protein